MNMKKVLIYSLMFVVTIISCNKDSMDRGPSRFYFSVNGPFWNGEYTISEEDSNSVLLGIIIPEVPNSDGVKHIQISISNSDGDVGGHINMLPQEGFQVLEQDELERNMILTGPNDVELTSVNVSVDVTEYKEGVSAIVAYPEVLVANFEGTMQHRLPDGSTETYTVKGDIVLN